MAPAEDLVQCSVPHYAKVHEDHKVVKEQITFSNSTGSDNQLNCDLLFSGFYFIGITL